MPAGSMAAWTSPPPARVTRELFAEIPGKKGRGTTSFRLGKLAKKVRAGEVEFRITINRGRCTKLRRAVAKYGAGRVKLRLTITLDPASGPERHENDSYRSQVSAGA